MKIHVTSTSSESFGAELFEMARIFFPEAKRSEPPCDCIVEHSAVGTLEEWTDELELSLPSGKILRARIITPSHESEREWLRRRKRRVKMSLYRLLKAELRIHPPWGALTGVRPTSLYAERVAAGETPQKAVVSLVKEFDITSAKAELLSDVYWMQRSIMDAAEKDLDIYVGIPFCPTVCDYCSFASLPIGKYSAQQIGDYVDALKHELIAVAPMLSDLGFAPRCIYIGGGTPTALPRHLLEELLVVLYGLFPKAIEWTVEAGRPDTLDKDTLSMLRDAHIPRISINPQTMNEKTLRAIGRGHTVADTIEAFNRARPLFPIINMDVIVALPGETYADMLRTLEILESMRPDNLTVHSLAIKRASKFHEEGVAHEAASAADAAEMVGEAARSAGRMGLLPYYLYRQKSTAGGLENVGYARPGTACRYNVDIMEESVPIAAFGAGGISKAIFADNRIERAPNVRNVTEYVTRIEEMIVRKRLLWKQGAGGGAS